MDELVRQALAAPPAPRATPMDRAKPCEPCEAALQKGGTRIMLVAGTGDATPAPATGLTYETLRRHRNRTVIRPTRGRTTFTSTWTIEWSSFPLRLEGPGVYRAFLNEASREKPALPTSTKRTSSCPIKPVFASVPVGIAARRGLAAVSTDEFRPPSNPADWRYGSLEDLQQQQSLPASRPGRPKIGIEQSGDRKDRGRRRLLSGVSLTAWAYASAVQPCRHPAESVGLDAGPLTIVSIALPRQLRSIDKGGLGTI
jgi:hypothetical protein